MAQNYRIPIPKTGFHPPVYVCKRNDKAFHLDGRLEKDFWADIPFTQEFKDIEGDSMPLPRFSTRAKLCWDEKNLYIGAVLEGTEIWGNVKHHDEVIFADNDFEIFIDPDSDTQAYIEYEMNALNTTWDLLLTKAYRDGGFPINSFEYKGLRSAVHIEGELNNPQADNRRWSVEIVLPLESLGECANGHIPQKGDFCRMNFSRVQWKVDIAGNAYQKRTVENGKPLPEDNWVWAPTGVINIHYPELWSFVFFGGAPSDSKDEQFAIPENELLKWELRKLYYAQQAIRDESGRFTDDLQELKDTLARLSPCEENASVRELPYQIHTTPHSFEISVPAADGKGKVVIFSDGCVNLI